jgi:asparagine synthase (glutamine-hydrolysing)
MDLRDRARRMERLAVPGCFLEAGCALGGSAIMLAASKATDRALRVYDVFGTIPPPTEKDGVDVHDRYRTIAAGEAAGFHGELYYGYQQGLKDKVAAAFAEFGYPCKDHHIVLVEGLFEDTLRPAESVALAHIDGDWYESVKVCLERIWPVLSPGGVMVIDDYDAWSGCRTAVDEFLLSHPECRTERLSRVHLLKA